MIIDHVPEKVDRYLQLMRALDPHLLRDRTRCITVMGEQSSAPGAPGAPTSRMATLMNGLNLANPTMMDVAVPANMRQGLHQEDVARRGWAYSAEQGWTWSHNPTWC